MPLIVPDRGELPDGLVATPLPVERVLYEAEYPIVYLTKTVHGQRLLAYVADDSADGVVTLLAPIAEESLRALEQGALGIREALGISWLWLHWVNGEQSSLRPTELSEIPPIHLPLAGTPLLSEHEPVLRTRALGENVVLGRMPASVVAFVADATRKAFKTLLDFTSSINPEGRPTEEHRALYDLPIQQFAFASFELSFGPPSEGLFERAEVRAAAEKLRTGLAWASTLGNEAPLPAESDEERAAILRAVLLLTPPASGPISEVHVSGTWVSQTPVRLIRQSRTKVRQELRAVETETIVSLEGRIGELDVDNLSFILRDTEAGQDRRGTFMEDALDNVLQYLAEGTRVAIAGVERLGKLYALAIAPAKDGASLQESPEGFEPRV